MDLSSQGVGEAHEAARLLKAEGYTFDVAYTSVLKRAIRTLWVVLDELDLMWIPVHSSWRLNERHYGALQGLDKKATADKYGLEQVHIWRRSYDTAPPPLTETDPRNPSRDPRYVHLRKEQFPKTESLKDTLHRVLPYWRESISPTLRQGKKIIISAHGNSLRALVKHLDNISDKDIPMLEIPTGVPLVYELNDHLRAVTHYYLRNRETLEKAAGSGAGQLQEVDH